MKDSKTVNIEIVEYNPKWPQIFKNEAQSILTALEDNYLAIHHFGSTSVPELRAKPKIDILAVVKDLKSLNITALERLGFENRGEVIPTGRYFSKVSPGTHLHVFEEGNPLIEQNLNFRNWLRIHISDRKAYAQLKKQLASLHNDGMSFCKAKTKFITNILKKIEVASQNNQQKFLVVKQLKLPSDQYAITGSGPMGIRNLKEIGDIDIIVISKLWNDLSNKYPIINQNGIKKISIPGDVVTILSETSFYRQPKENNEPTITQRISESETIEGLPFESFKHVLYYKRKMGREKDFDDIRIIENWQKFQNQN